jgi:hypothetical protein
VTSLRENLQQHDDDDDDDDAWGAGDDAGEHERGDARANAAEDDDWREVSRGVSRGDGG